MTFTVTYRDKTGAKREEAIEAASSASIAPLSLAVFKGTLVKI